MSTEPSQVLNQLFDELFPICRSITGPGICDSLAIVAKHLPLTMHRFPTGTRVFDWEVPPEWHIRAARLTGPDGKNIADFTRTNLAVMNFSEPVDKRLPLEALRPHLYTLPDLPDTTPYVTSYYRKNWGFCLPQEQADRLGPGMYHALIDAEHVDGHLQLGEAVIEGESDQEILLSTYLCHPSLANNELSGPLTMVDIYRRLSSWPRRHFTYRFVIAPETIGSLAYLSLRGDHLRDTVVGGLVLTCTGGPAPGLSYKTSRRENAQMDLLVAHLQRQEALKVDIRPFDPTDGSDERQYCSPGFNLPIGQMARTTYGTYDGYHNSRDDKAFMGIDPVIATAAAVEGLLHAFEWSGRFLNLSPHGEPQLGKRNLYPNVNSEDTREDSTDALTDKRTFLNRLLTILSYSDGEHSMLWIADRLHCSVSELVPVVERLIREDLLARVDP